MTSWLMHKAFELRIDLIAPLLLAEQKPNTDTIFSFLNAAQLRFVKQQYLIRDQIPPERPNTRTGWKSDESIRTLQTSAQLDADGINNPTGFPQYKLPSDFFLPSHGICTNITRTHSHNSTKPTRLECVLGNLEQLSHLVETQHNKPIIKYPVIAFMGGKQSISDPDWRAKNLVLGIDSYTLPVQPDLYLVYYRFPIAITLTVLCELSPTVHVEIVEMAVNMFMTEGKYYYPNLMSKTRSQAMQSVFGSGQQQAPLQQ